MNYTLTNEEKCDIISKVNLRRHLSLRHIYAGMAELADALDSGSNGRKAVQVQVLLPAPWKTDLFRQVGFSIIMFYLRGGNYVGNKDGESSSR